MIGDHLLPHRVAPVPSFLSIDDYGNPMRVPGEPGPPVPAFVQPLEASEDVADGQLKENRYKVFGNADTQLAELDAWSHVEWENRRYELVGDPRRHDTPDGRHHVTLTVRRAGA